MSTETSSCDACGYSRERQGPLAPQYDCRVKLAELFVVDSYWHLGSQYLLKDSNLRPACNEPAIHDFIKGATTIPIPKIIAFWEESGGRFMSIQERIQGEKLADVWPSLSETDREDIANQTATYLNELRSLKSNRIEGVHGAPLHSSYLFGEMEKPSGPFDTKEEFWEAMAGRLREKGLPTKAIDALGRSMPPPEPYTFSLSGHGLKSVIVKEKKVVGITDWYTAGYLPCWYDYATAGIGEDAMDMEWLDMLKPKLEKHRDGAEWFYRFLKLTKYPKLCKEGDRILEDLENHPQSLDKSLANLGI